MRSQPFGSLVTAMVTPFDENLALDLPAAADLAHHLVEEMHNDALVVSGTTGEAPTTTAQEKYELLKTVRSAVGNRAKVIAGVGSASTAESVYLARQAQDAGADGLLVVTPYYSKPPQAGVIAHFETIADATPLPILVYDIPNRTATPILTDSLMTLAQHENIVAIKDAKGDLKGTSEILAQTDVAIYSGDDAVTLPLLAIGATGVVGTSTHFSGAATKQMIEAFTRGDIDGALALHQRLLPVYTGVFAAQGCTMVKAGLNWQGHRVGGLRPPQMSANERQLQEFVTQLEAAGLA